ncbi:MAG: cupin domain-containing protein [Rhodocyclaceae bacterium]|nr:cupin domain-containing protein [Rhodocyclaceae bacterium]
MSDRSIPVAIMAAGAPLRTRPTLYPEPVAAMLASRLSGRHKRPLGDLFGLKNFGVNLTRLEPNAVSSLRHAHERQDEFVFILQGCPSLLTNEGKTRLSPGMCAGFRAGTGNAHTLINETGEDVVYLEIGDRTSGDEVTYPDDDLHAQFNDGQWTFSHKDGTPY